MTSIDDVGERVGIDLAYWALVRTPEDGPEHPAETMARALSEQRAYYDAQLDGFRADGVEPPADATALARFYGGASSAARKMVDSGRWEDA